MPVIAAVAATAIGSTIAAGASIYQGIQAERASDRAAALQREQGRIAARQESEQARRRRAENEALIGASGVTGAGSPNLANLQGVLDSLEQQSLLRRNAALQASVTESEGNAALIGGILTGIGTGFSGIGDVGLLGRNAGLFGRSSFETTRRRLGGALAPGVGRL